MPSFFDALAQLWMQAMNAIDGAFTVPILIFLAVWAVVCAFLLGVFWLVNKAIDWLRDAYWRHNHPAPRAAGLRSQRKRLNAVVKISDRRAS